MWLHQFFMDKSHTAALTVRLTPRQDVDARASVRQEIEEQECVHTYVEAVNYLLFSYAIDDVIANTDSKIKSFIRFSSQMAVKFAEALKDKVLRCGDAFSKQKNQEHIRGGTTPQCWRQHTHVLGSKIFNTLPPTGSVCGRSHAAG